MTWTAKLHANIVNILTAHKPITLEIYRWTVYRLAFERERERDLMENLTEYKILFELIKNKLPAELDWFDAFRIWNDSTTRLRGLKSHANFTHAQSLL